MKSTPSPAPRTATMPVASAALQAPWHEHGHTWTDGTLRDSHMTKSAPKLWSVAWIGNQCGDPRAQRAVRMPAGMRMHAAILATTAVIKKSAFDFRRFVRRVASCAAASQHQQLP